jgi:hypothetical protein
MQIVFGFWFLVFGEGNGVARVECLGYLSGLC